MEYSSDQKIKVGETMVNDILANYITTDIFEPMSTERQEYESCWLLDDAQVMGYFKAEWKEGEVNEERSKVFVNLTQRKILAILAVIVASEFQNGQIPCNIGMTPVPSGPWAQLLPEQELRRRTKEIYKTILDWNLQSNFKFEFIEWLWQLVVYGNAFWNTPFPKINQKEQYAPVGQDPITGELIFKNTIIKEIIPVGQCLNLWDCFLDPESQDSQSGQGVIYRPQMSPDQLVDLVNSSPLFDKKAGIEIAESWGNREVNDINMFGSYDPRKENITDRKENINIFEFYGRLPGEILLDKDNKFRKTFAAEIPESNSKIQSYECKVIVAENRTIYAGFNKNGSRPIYNATWVKPAFHAYGFGIPRKMRDMQSLTNGLTRAYVDSKKFSSVPLMAVNEEALHDSEDGTIHPNKLFKLDIDSSATKISDVFSFMRFPDTGGTLNSILQFAMSQADDDSNVPKQMEGQYANKETTATEVNVTAMGANAQLELILEKIDIQMLVPHFKAQYQYLMINPAYAKIHADANVKATGYKTYIQKTVMFNSLTYVLQLLLGTPNEEVKMSAKIPELVKAIITTKNLDPEDFFLSPEEVEEKMQKRMVQQEQAKIFAQQQAAAEEAAKYEQKDFERKTKGMKPEDRNILASLRDKGALDRAENQAVN